MTKFYFFPNQKKEKKNSAWGTSLKKKIKLK